MAGDWIQMRHDLADDPAVVQLAADCGLEIDHVIGKLWRLWSWADRQTVNGNAPGVTLVTLDSVIGQNGFGKVLESVGWLRVNARGIAIPKFDRYISESAKKRALAARRARRFRGKHRNAQSVTDALPRAEQSIRYATLRTAVEKLDWQEVHRLGQSQIQDVDALPDADNRLLLYQAAAMVTLGILPEMWFVEPMARLVERQKKRKGRIKKPMAWLTGVFKATAADHGQDFRELRGIITVPDWLVDGKPEGDKQ